MMEQWFFVFLNLGMALLWLMLGLLFYCSQGGAANWLTGTLDDSLDKKMLCRTYGRQILLWSIPFCAGAAADCLIPPVGTALAWASWLVLFIRLLLLRTKLEKSGKP